jgi:glycosyltransferase involved in cell wall biosynthesis
MNLKLDECGVCFYCADQNPSRDRSRGITYYTDGLLTHLRGMVQLKTLVSKSSFPVPDSIERIELPFRSNHLPGRLMADHFHPLLVRRHRAAIWHYPKGFLPFGPQVRAKKVGTVADVMLQYEADHYPHARSKLAFVYWLGMLKHSLQHLDLVITVSEFSKRAISEFCLRHRLRPPPIVVTYQGVTISARENEASNKEDYVVHLASKLFYKGTRWLLEQWLALQNAGHELPKLKLVGVLDSVAQRLYQQIANASLIPPLPRNELENVIARARALLLPSEIEGFGRAAVEGYLLGTPVAYAKGTALEEILGGDSPGGFFRERDSFHAALAEVVNMDRDAVEQKAATLRCRYNWNDCVRRTLEAYRTLL